MVNHVNYLIAMRKVQITYHDPLIGCQYERIPYHNLKSLFSLFVLSRVLWVNKE